MKAALIITAVCVLFAAGALLRYYYGPPPRGFYVVWVKAVARISLLSGATVAITYSTVMLGALVAHFLLYLRNR